MLLSSSSPALPDVAARPSGGLFRFWAQALQRLSANHFAPSGTPHRGHSAVKRAWKLKDELSTVAGVRSFSHLQLNELKPLAAIQRVLR